MSVGYDVASALDALGIDYSVHGTEANSYCPMHEQRTGKEDNSPSWWINLDTGAHTCFSCHYVGNLVHLVCDVKGFKTSTWGITEDYDYEAAKQWLATVAELSIEDLMAILDSLPSYIKSIPKMVEMSEARLAIFTEPPAEALASRNISAEAARQFSVLWEPNKKLWILPLRDPRFQELMGWQEKGTVDRTFRNAPAGLQKSKTLFGLDRQEEDVVIVVESPLDCVRIGTAGYSSVVAICGSSPSEQQVKLLRYSNKIIAAFDNPNLDKAGEKASKEMLDWARKYGLNLHFFNYGDSGKKDPGDMTDAEICWGVENAQSALYGELAYVQRNTQTLSG